jgi:hypothetical protein
VLFPQGQLLIIKTVHLSSDAYSRDPDPDRGCPKIDKSTILSIKKCFIFPFKPLVSAFKLHEKSTAIKREQPALKNMTFLHFSFSLRPFWALLDPSLDKRINKYEFPTLKPNS